MGLHSHASCASGLMARLPTPTLRSNSENLDFPAKSFIDLGREYTHEYAQRSLGVTTTIQGVPGATMDANASLASDLMLGCTAGAPVPNPKGALLGQNTPGLPEMA